MQESWWWEVREKYLEWDYEWKNEIERLYNNMQMTWLKKAVDCRLYKNDEWGEWWHDMLRVSSIF